MKIINYTLMVSELEARAIHLALELARTYPSDPQIHNAGSDVYAGLSKLLGVEE